MAAVVHIVRLTSAKTFTDYMTQHMVPFLESQLPQIVTRVNAICDNYPEISLKSFTHQHHVTGPRTRIGNENPQIPKHDWNSGFLKMKRIKKELFSFLSDKIVRNDFGGKLLISTKFEHVLSNKPCEMSGTMS